MKTAHKTCVRFLKCSVNNCPLHPEYPDLFIFKDDPERKCTLAKTIRIRIASEHPQIKLKYKGLTSREYNAKKRWDNLPETEKEAMRQRAKNFLPQKRKKAVLLGSTDLDVEKGILIPRE